SARLEVGELQRSGGELVEEKEGALREVADLRQIIADQAEQWDALNSQVKILSSREGNLRSLLLDAHDQLIRRDDELSQAIDEQARLRQALQEQAHLHHLLHTLTEEKEAAHREANALRQTIQEQSGLSDQIESAVEEKETVQCE